MSGFPGIKRELGESEADYRRRYDREKMRFYRAQKPKSTKKRGKGKGPAKNGKLTQEEWEALQQRPDETDEEHKARYNREAMRRHRTMIGKDAANAQARAYHAENRDHILERRALNYDPVKQREYNFRYIEKNPEMAAKRHEGLKQWGIDNAARLKEAKAEWNANNRALLASYSAAWRKSCRIQTPPWIDNSIVLRFYEEAQRLTEQTGIKHNVDHIIPVQGKHVRGLHVHTNLRIIPASDNFKKRNKFEPELLEFFDNLIIW